VVLALASDIHLYATRQHATFELARHSSAAQLERIVPGIRRATRVEAVEADPEEAAYRMRTRHRYDADDNLVVTIYAPAEDAPVILAGLEAQRAELDRQRQARVTEPAPGPVGVPAATPEAIGQAYPSLTPQVLQDAIAGCHAPMLTSPGPVTPAYGPVGVSAGTPSAPTDDPAAVPEPSRATDGYALLAMAVAALDTQRAKHPDIARRNRSRLVAQVDPLSGWARLHDGEVLPPTSLRSVLKSLPGRGGILRLRPLTGTDLTVHDLGRTTREPSLALRELLGSLDGERCRFPGCTRHKKLHAHHVVYWSADGRTDLAYLLLLCSRHHTLVHQFGFQLGLHTDRRLEVRTADGTAGLHHPAKPWGDPTELDPTGGVSAGTLPTTHCDSRMDLNYVVCVLLQQAA
jgi:hypothetical protein